jgi:hypothetical protein
MAMPASRPRGITILAVLAAIGGIFGILGSVTLIGLSGTAVAAAALGGLASVIGLVGLALSVGQLVLAYGFWNLRPWAWQAGFVLWGASIVFSILQVLAGTPITSVIVSILIAAAILYYLNTPTVRQAFSRPATGF